MKPTWKSVLAGAAAGLINGLLGAGGGMVLVPLLRDWLGLDEKKAMATTVFCVAPLCVVSVIVYSLHGAVDWAAAWPYALGGLAGGLLAGKWFRALPPDWLRRGFGALLIFGGLRMVFAA